MVVGAAVVDAEMLELCPVVDDDPRIPPTIAEEVVLEVLCDCDDVLLLELCTAFEVELDADIEAED